MKTAELLSLQLYSFTLYDQKLQAKREKAACNYDDIKDTHWCKQPSSIVTLGYSNACLSQFEWSRWSETDGWT